MTVPWEKQKLLQLPQHKIVRDIPTRWNSALDMITRYLEQQLAVHAVLTAKELVGKDKDIATLCENITCAEELISILTPLKVATTALCEEKIPTISMILSQQHQLLHFIMKEKVDDTLLIKQVRKSVVDDFSRQYQDVTTRKFLTLLDPQFKTVPFLSDNEKLDAYHNLTVEAV